MTRGEEALKEYARQCCNYYELQHGSLGSARESWERTLVAYMARAIAAGQESMQAVHERVAARSKVPEWNDRPFKEET